jgi:hypothetical protein
MRETPPVLFLVFRRPELTARVFEAIRGARPARLFVAADGPRPGWPDDAERCARARRAATAVDWPCDLRTLFRERNLGCGVAVSEAIRWFFGQVEEGLVLEDDTLPDASFFPYCAELLEHYRHDTRVMHIAGYNPLEHGCGDGSYYFSPLMHCWGWATWRRVAAQYDFRMADFPRFKEQGLIRAVFRTRLQQRHFLRIFETYHRGAINNWDQQWLYMIVSRHGLCINPAVNLVRNIGFGVDSTFAANPWSYHGRRAAGSLTAIRHPSFVLAHPAVTERILRRAYGVSRPRLLAAWLAARLLRPAGRGRRGRPSPEAGSGEALTRVP